MSELDRLMTPEGQQLLASNKPISSKDDVLALVSKLRKLGHDSELVAQVVTQLRLRERARAKFGDFANSMLFTEQGLEQASRLQVAAHHAGKFLSAGIKSVTDMGCGIAADSLAFAGAAIEVVAVDLDPDAASAASYNLAPFENVEVYRKSAQDHEITTEALWFDPARRNLERKTASRELLSPADFSPNLEWIFEKAQNYPTGVKLGPAFPKELIPQNCEVQWVSNRGDLVELTLWFGKVASPGFTALQIGDQTHSFKADRIELAPAGKLGEFLYEPDPAMIRSGLMGNLALQLGLSTFSSGIAYLSSDEQIESPWLKGYQILEQLPLDVKTLANYCHKNDIGVVEIKKRGVDITPEQLRPKLKLKGAGAATMVLTKVGDARQALICKPIR